MRGCERKRKQVDFLKKVRVVHWQRDPSTVGYIFSFCIYVLIQCSHEVVTTSLLFKTLYNFSRFAFFFIIIYYAFFHSHQKKIERWTPVTLLLGWWCRRCCCCWFRRRRKNRLFFFPLNESNAWRLDAAVRVSNREETSRNFSQETFFFLASFFSLLIYNGKLCQGQCVVNVNYHRLTQFSAWCCRFVRSEVLFFLRTRLLFSFFSHVCGSIWARRLCLNSISKLRSLTFISSKRITNC